MSAWTADRIRSEFLKYFEEHGHRVVSSYPLVPPNDPSLLFTNAGMVQFKDVFTGQQERTCHRATSSQKCVRAGGKHNDLENVGLTARHHTFFEMLGNFSFGDYFKSEAIRFGWQFLTERMGLDPDRLWVSVFGGDEAEGLEPDDEAARIWEHEIGLDPERILRFGKKDNFWAMGDTGPCGPCSEIHYDQSDRVACSEPGPCAGVDCECDRYLEVWNLVFMQYNRDAGGKLAPLPAPSIDTGMGLERLAAVVQAVASNYDTDLFRPLLERMGEIAGTPYGRDAQSDISLRVVADHARATAFLMSDGVLPANEGRGYVLRRIMRRAIRHGAKLGVDEPFFHRICLEVVRRMGHAYPELEANDSLIDKATRLEEESFRRTLNNGLRRLQREIERLQREGRGELDGKLVFDLKTRDGFPIDLTAVIAREHGLTIDQAGYEKQWRRHQEVSAGELGLAGVDAVYHPILQQHGATAFTGYDREADEGRVLALLRRDGDARVPVERAEAGTAVEAVISPTPFYGESGGQVGDTGWIESASGLRAEVRDARRPLAELTVLEVQIVSGRLATGDVVQQRVDGDRRQRIRLNHSATHLLQTALRRVLGKHVNQKGSLVAPDRLRFDFSHFAPLSREELDAVEREVNALVRANASIEAELTALDDARQAGATMLFGEKYGERVRMVRMGGTSLELCGGTHAARTGDIGLLRITTEAAVQAGVRRIEAVTGPGAIEQMQQADAQLRAAASALKSPPAQLAERAAALADRERQLARRVDDLRQKLATAGSGGAPTDQAREIGGVPALATRVEGIEMASLREVADQLRDKLGEGIVLVASETRGKVAAVCSVPKSLTDRVRAGDLLKAFFAHTGGGGGGRPDYAQGGGGDPAKLEQGLEAFYPAVEAALGG